MLESSTVLKLFEQVARENVDRIALVAEDRELSYEELERLSTRIAAVLKNAGVARGDCVGLSMDRCPEAIAAMFAAFKIGAAFVPLDPEYPVDRLQYMIQDANISVVVTRHQFENPIARQLDGNANLCWVDCADLDRDRPELELCDTNFGEAAPSDLAYVMYTSGSTGMPKGVQIEHSALVAYCLADIEVYKLTSDDRTLQFSTLNFDIAIEEIFPPLLIGSTVVIRPLERSSQMNELSEIVDRYEVTAIHLATAYWHEWVDLMVGSDAKAPQSLRLVIATGEKVSTEHYRRWLALCEHDVLWCNAYGPTEATVTATVFIPGPDFNDADMPIGYPLPGYEAYILTEDKCCVTETGVTGELFIGGPALARGYLNREDLTAKAFVEVSLEDRTERLYRTGDLARWRSDGSIEFAGRIDHQIKLGSYRIEPGEIEASINRHPSVLESLVTYEAVGSQKFLLAYVATSDNDLAIESLAEFLRSEIPSYMVPARYILVDQFPKTINGKVDRQGLPAPETARTAQDLSYTAPRTEMEEHLCNLWARVLNLPRVGVYDDFFALGGSSLLVTKVVAEIKQHWDLELPVRDFFANPTVATAATHVQRLLGQEVSDIVQEQEHLKIRQQQPTVHPNFIGCAGRELFTIHYQPSSVCRSRRHAVLICQSIGHEYTRAYRNLQQLALVLATHGFDVLRFDYFGTGNSNGNCSEFRLESMQSDMRRAADYVMEVSGAEHLSLAGIRVGATLAAMMCTEGGLTRPVQKLVAWDPIGEGPVFLQTLQRLNEYALSSQTRFPTALATRPNQSFGHEWSREKRASLSHLRLPPVSELSVARQLMLVSQDYYEVRPKLQGFADGWNLVRTQDEIYWASPEFTESAFASPTANQEILNFLTRDNHGAC